MPNPLTDADLAAIEEREKRATRGPWMKDCGGFIYEDQGPDALKIGQIWNEDDARFVAWSRTDIPRLLDDNRRLKDELESMWTNVHACALRGDCKLQDDATTRAGAIKRAETAEAEVRRLKAELDNPVRTGVCEVCVEKAIKDNDSMSEDVRRLRLGLEKIASCKVVSVDPPDCPQIARNLLAGREWDNCADGAKGEG